MITLDCADVQTKLALYHGQELDPPTRAALEAHLATCDECSEAEDAHLLQLIHDDDAKVEPPRDLAARWHRLEERAGVAAGPRYSTVAAAWARALWEHLFPRDLVPAMAITGNDDVQLSQGKCAGHPGGLTSPGGSRRVHFDREPELYADLEQYWGPHLDADGTFNARYHSRSNLHDCALEISVRGHPATGAASEAMVFAALFHYVPAVGYQANFQVYSYL